MNMEHFKAGHVKYELDTKAELSYMCVNSDPKIKKERERERERPGGHRCSSMDR